MTVRDTEGVRGREKQIGSDRERVIRRKIEKERVCVYVRRREIQREVLQSM